MFVGQFPPDCMHDFLEKTGPCDGAAIINGLISAGIITLEQYNRVLANIRLTDYERGDRPPKLKKDAKKLPGKALSIALHIRLMPFLLWQVKGDTWLQDQDLSKMVLLLNRINEFLLADSFSIADTENLEDILISYFETREKCQEKYNIFGNLTPKDHNLEHYKEQIKRHGPLTVTWAARGEQKHQEYLRMAMRARNFINLPRTLAVKGQKLLAYRLVKIFY